MKFSFLVFIFFIGLIANAQATDPGDGGGGSGGPGITKEERVIDLGPMFREFQKQVQRIENAKAVAKPVLNFSVSEGFTYETITPVKKPTQREIDQILRGSYNGQILLPSSAIEGLRVDGKYFDVQSTFKHATNILIDTKNDNELFFKSGDQLEISPYNTEDLNQLLEPLKPLKK